MFGFGNKQQQNQNQPQKAGGEKKQGIAAAQLPEDQFTVMPQQYLPRVNKKTSPFSKKTLLIAGTAVVMVVVVAALLYFFLATSDTGITDTGQPAASQPAQQPGETQNTDEEDTTTQDAPVTDTVVVAEAYSEENRLVGTLSMTIPAAVVAEAGGSIGIAVISLADIGIASTTQSSIFGGLYSLYPAARTFVEPISFELSVTQLPAGTEKQDLFPARLVGADFKEIEDYQLTAGGYAFEFEKFPGGPITLMYRDAVSSSATGTEETFSPEPVPATKDTDQDGLTDKEEQLFGTSAAAADSDEDTYQDKEEIENGYSPLAPGDRLEDAGIFADYTNATYGYRVSYPTAWLADSLDQTNQQVLFISETEEFFEILIEENPLNTPIVDWYRAQAPSLTNIDLDVTIVNGRPAVWSPDGLTLYTGKNGLVYILTYNKGALDAINWPFVFERFYKSFRFGEVVNPGTAGSDTDPSGAGSDTGTPTPPVAPSGT